jgi:hypothetical protein
MDDAIAFAKSLSVTGEQNVPNDEWGVDALEQTPSLVGLNGEFTSGKLFSRRNRVSWWCKLGQLAMLNGLVSIPK